MRLDQYLRKCRIVKQRSSAKRACDEGIVFIDGVKAKAGRRVFPGQRITLDFLDRTLEIEVVDIPIGNVSKPEARNFCRILRDERKSWDWPA